MRTQAKDVDTCENGDVNGSRVRETQERLIGGRAATQLARTFSALSDPTRLRIISALSHNEMCVHGRAAADVPNAVTKKDPNGDTHRQQVL